VKDNKENKQKTMAMAQAAQDTGNSTASKGNGFDIPTESGAALDDDYTNAFAAMEQRDQDIQPKEPPQGPDQGRKAWWTYAAVASLLTAMQISCRDIFIAVLAVAVAVAVTYVGPTFSLKGAEGASVHRGATGTRGIDLNAFGMDQYDMHRVRRQTRSSFASPSHYVRHCIGKLAGYDDMGVDEARMRQLSFASTAGFADGQLFLDSCCSRTIIHDAKLLTNIRPLAVPKHIMGGAAAPWKARQASSH
jgi:hypothetical protein